MSKRDDRLWYDERKIYDSSFSAHKAYRVPVEERAERIAQLEQAVGLINRDCGSEPVSARDARERAEADYSSKRSRCYNALSMLFIARDLLDKELNALRGLVAGDPFQCERLEDFLAREAKEQYEYDNWEELEAAKRAAKLERLAKSIARAAARVQAKENRESAKALKVVQKLDNSLFAF